MRKFKNDIKELMEVQIIGLDYPDNHRSRLFFERRYLKRRFRLGPAVVLFLRVYSPEAVLLTGKGL
jgi:hypothetical protein